MTNLDPVGGSTESDDMHYPDTDKAVSYGNITWLCEVSRVFT